ncbi:MAG: NHL repeat-containing protein [Candidatus Geothermincolia bacterium]
MKRPLLQKFFTALMLIAVCSAPLSAVALGGQKAPAPGAGNQTYTWDFNDPLEYSYDSSLITVSNGLASNKLLPASAGWWKTYLHCSFEDYGGEATAVTCDKSDNVIAVGARGAWVCKLKSSDGSVMWEKAYAPPGLNAGAYAVTCDSEGNIYVAGYAEREIAKPDGLIRKYDSNGSLIWSRTYQYATGGSFFTGVCLDANGNPITIGYETDDGTAHGYVVLRKWTSSGAVVWTTHHFENNIGAMPGNPNAAILMRGDGSLWAFLDAWGNIRTIGSHLAEFDTGNGALRYQQLLVERERIPGYKHGLAEGSDGLMVLGWPIAASSPGYIIQKYDPETHLLVGQGKVSTSGYDLVGCDVAVDNSNKYVLCGNMTKQSSGEPYGVRTKWVSSGGPLESPQCIKCNIASEQSNAVIPRGTCVDSRRNIIAGGFGYPKSTGTNYRGIAIGKYPPNDYDSAPVTALLGADLTKSFPIGFGYEGTQYACITFQLSPDGDHWYYYDSNAKKWVEYKTGLNEYGEPLSNTGAVVNSNIRTFNEIATSKLFVRAWLNTGNSTSISPVELDKVYVQLEPRKAGGANWYFAEGCTRPGFDTYLSIQNPGEDLAQVRVTYMLGDGTTKQQTVNVGPHARWTVNTADTVGTGEDPAHDFSIRAESTTGQGVICERAMYFNYKPGTNNWNGGHDVVGATHPATTWYFAEGSCRPGFDPYICVQNPDSSRDTTVKVTYMLGSGASQTQEVKVNRNTRVTISAKDRLGEGNDAAHDFSAKVETTDNLQVVAERSMYFNYKPGEYNWNGGHDVMGATNPSLVWYFAEGSCRPGFDPYICLQNPGATAADLRLTYMLGDGSTKTQDLELPARSRSTVEVKQVLGTGDDAAHDFSCKVESTNRQLVIAERPTYFNYRPGVRNWSDGHDVVGATSPSTLWYLAEGCSRPTFDTYICIQNPWPSDCNVSITYMMGDGTTKQQDLPVKKNSRATVSAKDFLGQGDAVYYDFSMVVGSTGSGVIVERPEYFNYRPGDYNWNGGHDVVAF